MKRILLAAAALGSLAACTYVEERPQRSSAYGYGYNTAPAPAAGGGYRDGSYEAERQAYEYGRRDGNSSSRGWWR
jgi:hypothetical protein